MSEELAPVVPTPILTGTMDMLRSVLMGLGTPLLAHGVFTGSQWQDIVGGLVALASGVWSYVAAHPDKIGALKRVLILVRASGRQKQWNKDAGAIALALEPYLIKAIDAQIHARAGLLAGPLDTAANAAVRDVARQAVGHITIPST